MFATPREISIRSSTVIIAALIFGCASVGSREWGQTDKTANPVSIIELVANGSAYDGWRIRVQGIIHTDKHRPLLFPNALTHDKFDAASSIFIATPEPESGELVQQLPIGDFDLDGRTVLIEGQYFFSPRKKLAADEILIGIPYIGVIENVTYVLVLEGP